MGRWVAWDVLLNGQRLFTLAAQEKKEITLPQDGGILRVELDGCVSSGDVSIGPDQNGQTFVCDTAWWIPLDVFDLCYTTAFRNRVFCIERVADECRLK